MLDKVGGTGRGELYGLGDTIKTNKAEKAPETKLEAGAVKSQSESGVSGAARYQLEAPKAPAVSNQAQVVANCHKMPQQWFDKRLLGIQEIANGMSQAFERLFTMNPDIQVQKAGRSATEILWLTAYICVQFN